MTYKRTKANIARAKAARAALVVAYSQAKGEGKRVDLDTVRDLFHDLMHWRAQWIKAHYSNADWYEFVSANESLADVAADEISHLCFRAKDAFFAEAEGREG